MFIDLQVIGITNQIHGHMIRDAVENAMLTLLPETDDFITIEIEVAKDEDMNGVLGFCHKEDENEYFISINEIILDDVEELITSVTHETIHCIQEIRGDLEDIDSKTKLWKGEVVSIDSTDYMNYPWEIEAYEMQNKVAKKVIDSYK